MTNRHLRTVDAELQSAIDAIQSVTPRIDLVLAEQAAVRRGLQVALVHLALAIQSLRAAIDHN